MIMINVINEVDVEEFWIVLCHLFIIHHFSIYIIFITSNIISVSFLLRKIHIFLFYKEPNIFQYYFGTITFFCVFVINETVVHIVTSGKNHKRNITVKFTHQQLQQNVGYLQEIISAELVLEMRIYQQMVIIHMFAIILDMIFCILGFPYLFHDSKPRQDIIVACNLPKAKVKHKLKQYDATLSPTKKIV